MNKTKQTILLFIGLLFVIPSAWAATKTGTTQPEVKAATKQDAKAAAKPEKPEAKTATPAKVTAPAKPETKTTPKPDNKATTTSKPDFKSVAKMGAKAGAPAKVEAKAKVKQPEIKVISKYIKIGEPTKDTVCINMETLNSTKDDYMPFLIGKTLIFTSNRKSAQEGQTVQYTEKVYFSTRKSKNKWTEPLKNGYKWNSDNNTALIGISPSLFYFYRSYWKDNGEIFVAQRLGDKKNPWKASQLRKLTRICSDFDECSIAPTNRGDSTFFVSNRNGSYDIFLQIGTDKAYPVDILNSEYDENDLYFYAPTNTLFFSSNRPGGIGGYDIYQSSIVDNQFEKPVLLRDTMINSTSDDRDFKKYNDSTMFLASNRKMGLGGYDIYEIRVKTKGAREEREDSTDINIVDEKIGADSIVDLKSDLYKKLKELGLFPFKGEVQVGAYRYIQSLEDFTTDKFPCIKSEKLKMTVVTVDGIKVHKFIVDTVYTDVDKAINKQVAIEAMHCLPDKVFSDMPFIGMLDKQGNRYAIFWKKDDFLKKKIFFIFKNGKQIWKSRKF
jgi:hypothetical protein